MERRTEVKPIQVTLQCDDCGGEMKPTGTALMTSPPQYPHVCEKCGASSNIRAKTYPYIEYIKSEIKEG